MPFHSLLFRGLNQLHRDLRSFLPVWNCWIFWCFRLLHTQYAGFYSICMLRMLGDAGIQRFCVLGLFCGGEGGFLLQQPRICMEFSSTSISNLWHVVFLGGGSLTSKIVFQVRTTDFKGSLCNIHLQTMDLCRCFFRAHFLLFTISSRRLELPSCKFHQRSLDSPTTIESRGASSVSSPWIAKSFFARPSQDLDMQSLCTEALLILQGFP